MPECAFCDHTGKLTAEHITSQWLRDLFTGPGKAWFGTTEGETRQFDMGPLDFKAKVVCKECNSGWMSDIERAAKHLLSPMITGQSVLAITPQIATRSEERRVGKEC